MSNKKKIALLNLHDFIKKHHWITHPDFHSILAAIVFVVAIFGIWFGAEHAILDYWNEKVVLAYLSSITSHWVSTTACVLISIFVIAVAIYRFVIRYQYRLSVVSVAMVLISLLFRYRFIETNLYDYVSPWSNGFKYVDFLLVWVGLYIIASIVNFIYNQYHKEQTIETKTSKPKVRRLDDGLLIPVLQSDNPINDVDEDELDYDKEIEKLIVEISDLDASQSWSIGISAPWGAGKTSFINLLKRNLPSANFEQLDFAPRNSKSAETIQADFFNQLVAVVAKTDVRIKSTMLRYMELLGVIDNTGIISKITQLGIWNDETSEQTLKDIFSEYPKRIIVFVEDFDRLTCPEIIEVLKLIDNNAAFPNIIFITAYDKENVSAMLQHDGIQNTTPFTDKFFNFEYVLPKRPYTYVKKYLYGLLANMIDNEKHKAVLEEMFDENKHDIDTFLQSCIATLRDAKRFYNMFATDYVYLQEDVVFKEFLFVELLKYHYPEVYHKLHAHEYLIDMDDTWGLQENCDIDEAAQKLLKELFSQEKVDEYGQKIESENPYRHIYDTSYFDNYFINGVYGYLRIKDMRKTIEEGLENSKETIDKWFDDGIKKTDYCLFLDDIIREDFTTREQYLNYVKIYMYLIIHHHTELLSWSKGNILQRQYVQNRLNKLEISEEEYTAYLLGLMNNVDWDPLMAFQRSLLIEIINDKEPEEYFITYNDLFPNIKRQFRIILEDKSIGDKDKYEYLKGCVFKTENSIKLVENCCTRYEQYIKRNPEWFVTNFVQLGEKFSSPEVNSITCIPFWEQIFGDRSKVYSFLSMKDNDTTPYIKRARNFWRLFRANEYQPIEFKNQGNVQAKIDNDFVEEIKQLEELENLKSEVNKLSLEIKSGKIDTRKLQFKINGLERKLSHVQLYIRLNGDLHTEIMKFKRLTQ